MLHERLKRAEDIDEGLSRNLGERDVVHRVNVHRTRLILEQGTLAKVVAPRHRRHDLTTAYAIDRPLENDVEGVGQIALRDDALVLEKMYCLEAVGQAVKLILRKTLRE